MAKTKVLWIKEEFLRSVLDGQKTVEVRVGYDNIRRLQPGDMLLLNEQYLYEIVDLRHYPDFAAMVAAEKTEAIAPNITDPQALLHACRAVYPPAKEALGVVALEIKKARHSTVTPFVLPS
jgi:ASC-1-like (ASCH) protein